MDSYIVSLIEEENFSCKREGSQENKLNDFFETDHCDHCDYCDCDAGGRW